MAIVEYEGKKYDTGYEFEWLQDDANSIKCNCHHYMDNSVTEAEKEELQLIASQMAELEQSYELMDSIKAILETRKELKVLSQKIHEKYGKRQ